MFLLLLNWRKGKPSGSKACTKKGFIEAVVMNDATPLTPPNA